MKRALLVGINKYPGAPLAGCVNDINDMAKLLVKSYGWQSQDIHMLVDERATTVGITEGLRKLIANVASGDKLLFYYSGHGAQVPCPHSAAEPDGLSEVICPVDFDWSPAKMITDHQFHGLFSAIPKGAELIWISDSCHSGDLEREMPKMGLLGAAKNLTPKSMEMPVDIRWHVTSHRGRSKTVKPNSFVHVATDLQLALVSGCKSNQTSADATFGGKPNGALSYYLQSELNKKTGQSLVSVVNSVTNRLADAGFAQRPQLDGLLEIMNKPFGQ